MLELKVPHGAQWVDLMGLAPVFMSYVLSFVNVAIYWNNHHHMMYAVKHVNGAILWANIHLLFWLSLLPFTTGWMGENHFAELPVAVYSVNLLLCAVAHIILQSSIIRDHGADSKLAHAVGRDCKGKVSLAAYVLAVPMALLGYAWPAGVLLMLVAIIWFIPDRRIEKVLSE